MAREVKGVACIGGIIGLFAVLASGGIFDALVVVGIVAIIVRALIPN